MERMTCTTPILPKPGDKNSSLHLTKLPNSSLDSQENVETGKVQLRNVSLRKKLFLLLLATGNFNKTLAYSLMAPFFPREAVRKGLSETIIGFIFSSYMFVAFLSSLFYGANITKFGVRFVLAAGTCVGGICAVLFGVLEHCPPGTPFIVLCFLARTIESLGMTAHTTASYAAAISEFPGSIATVQSIFEASLSFGHTVGPVFGNILYEAGGFGMPFYVIGTFIFISGIVLCGCLPHDIEVHKEDRPQKPRLLQSGNTWVILLPIFMCSFNDGFIQSNLALHIGKFGVKPHYVSYLFVCWASSYVCTAPIWGWLTDRLMHPMKVVCVGCLTCGISMMLLGPSPILPFIPLEIWVPFLMVLLNSFGVGWAQVPTMKCLVIGAREMGTADNISTHSAISGLFHCVWSLGAFCGPSAGGLIVEHLGFPIATTLIAAGFWLAGLIAALYFSIKHR